MKRLLLAAIFAAALPHLASAEDPIKIGYAISKTGPFAPAAQTQLNAYQLWADKVAADGGIDVGGVKRPVQFVVYDDQSDFGKAPAIYEKLITSDKVDLLLAPWGTPFHFSIVGILEKYHFPVVGNSAASTTIRDVKPGNIWFTTSAIPDHLASELVTMMKSRASRRSPSTLCNCRFHRNSRNS